MTKQKSRNTAFTINGIRYVPLASLFDREDDADKRHYRAVLRAIRKGDIDGAIQPMGDGTPYAVPETFDVNTVDVPTGKRSTRDDGRERGIVWLTPEEQTALTAWMESNGIPDDAYMSPSERRARAKKRRDARKQRESDDNGGE